MGVPASEVGYTIATTRRETTKVHKNMWWHWEKKTLRIHWVRYGSKIYLCAVAFTGMLNFNIGLSIKAVVIFQYTLSFILFNLLALFLD